MPDQVRHDDLETFYEAVNIEGCHFDRLNPEKMEAGVL